jgi:Ca2+-binding EF-hand superfamily protein
LPDWFAKNDADGDGQVAWAEFCRSAGSSAVADFRQFDLNDDGLITPQECLKAKAKGAVRTGESATTAVAAAGAPAPAGTPALTGTPAAAGTPVVAAPGPTAGTPASSPPAAPITIDPRTYDYAKKVLSKYDANGDGELTSAEWAGMSKNPEAADTDHNGRITVEEYARWTLQ